MIQTATYNDQMTLTAMICLYEVIFEHWIMKARELYHQRKIRNFLANSNYIKKSLW